jgi:hypothetical protein
VKYKEFSPFCSKDFSRMSIQVPILNGGWLYATDGHVCVRAQGVDLPVGFGEVAPKGMSQWPHPEKSVLDGLPRFFERETPAFRRVVNMPKQNPKVVCEGCMGEGGFQCEACDHPNECPACGGDGYNVEDIWLDLGGVLMSLNLLSRIAHFPNLEISLDAENPLKGQRFRFDGGEGVIIPLKFAEGHKYVPTDLFSPLAPSAPEKGAQPC